jgi:signal transduction histidine kinase
MAAEAKEAQRALLARPEVSIRARLSFSLLFWFLLTVGLSTASIVTLSSIGGKLTFTEALERYTFEIQQARRFEKNYFLYRTNLPEALEHVHTAQAILEQEEANISAIIGTSEHEGVLLNLQRYEALLARLQTLDQEGVSPTSSEYQGIENGLREHGALMVTEAENLVNRERRAVTSMLSISSKIPVAFIVVLVGVIAYLAVLIRQQVLAPLARMMRTTERIADGDFTPIKPVRKYHDEFSHLAIALNHMMMQLSHRQELLVQAHKLKAVGTLTAGVAHELNNPINNIVLTAAALEEDYEELPDLIRLGMVDDLVGEAERAQKIVRNLLDFARESSIQLGVIDPQHLMEETLRLATNQIKLAKVKVRGEIDPNLPPIYGDSQQLTQVLLNIVLNALDAMPGGGTLSIGIRNPLGKDHVTIELTDTGTGMPESVLSNIFDPFFTTKPGAKGTGLGLSVSLGIIRQHGGDIRVRSVPGEGTTFTVQLPVAMVPAPLPGEREGEPEEEEDDEDDIPIT